MRALLLLLVAAARAADLAYPTPPNPFASQPPQPPQPPPPTTQEAEPAAVKGGQRLRRRWKPSVKPILCLGVLGLACVAERPQEMSLLSAFDAHFQSSRGLIAPELRAEEYTFRSLGAVAGAVHMDLFWLGILGQWLPLLPLSTDALRHWIPALSAAQCLMLATAFGYGMRRLLPLGWTNSNLAASFKNLCGGRLWTFITATFCPAGLVRCSPCPPPSCVSFDSQSVCGSGCRSAFPSACKTIYMGTSEALGTSGDAAAACRPCAVDWAVHSPQPVLLLLSELVH